MKKTININFQGQLITIEETAYDLLNQYIQSLKEYFKHEAEGTEIVNDIENRIAELFGNRLKHGISCITDADVTSIINTIGRPEEFDMEYDEREDKTSMPPPHTESRQSQQMPPPVADEARKSLFRKSNDRILGGVCSGLAHYLKIDPVFTRILFVILFGFVFWVYIILWIVVPAKVLPNNVSKRLYRNPNDRFIAGVCGGIAAYFKIDTWIPRLVFLLPIIFNVVGLVRIPFNALSHFFFDSSFNVNLSSGVNVSFVIAYIVLWIIMPRAVTVKQKLEMMGEDEYLNSIRATVSDNVAQARSSRTDADNANVGAAANASVSRAANTTTASVEPADASHTGDSGSAPEQFTTPPPLPPINTTRATYTPHPSERSGCLNVLVGFLKVIFFGIVGLVAAGLMITLITLVFKGAQFIPLQSLFVNPGFEHTLLWLTMILTLVVPIIGVIVWIVRRIMKAKSRPIIGYTVAGLWFVGVVAGLTLGFMVTRKFSTEALQESNIELTSPTTNKLYVEMERYPLDYFSISPGESQFNFSMPGRYYNNPDLPFFNVEEDSLLFKSIQLRVKKSKDTLFHVRTIYSSFDKSYKVAKANTKEVDFRLQQNDSVLLIPEFFKIPREQGYRNQLVVVEIFVPSGSKLEVSDDLKDYERVIMSNAMRRKYGDRYNLKDNLEWDSDEEYVLEDEKLTETRLLQDSI